MAGPVFLGIRLEKEFQYDVQAFFWTIQKVKNKLDMLIMSPVTNTIALQRSNMKQNAPVGADVSDYVIDQCSYIKIYICSG